MTWLKSYAGVGIGAGAGRHGALRGAEAASRELMLRRSGVRAGMARRLAVAILASLAVALGGFALGAAAQGSASAFAVKEAEVDDLKGVFATVRSKDRIEARVRTGGTVVSLKVDEGHQVEPGQVLAVVADPKIALKIRALDAQILGLESRISTAKLDLERAEQLRARGVTPQARVDQLKTAFDLASNEIKAVRAERLVAEEQIAEGQVLAPAAGRVLRVPLTEGSVVMAGESVATIAANDYLLRLELPERHARFMKAGDPIKVGQRGLAGQDGAIGEGRISQVYPELQAGRVVADAEVPKLGDFFVGERVLVWISAGKRRTIVVPEDYIAKRFGLDYARLAPGKGAPIDVVVQLGGPAPLPDGKAGVEVLAGLKPGDSVLPQQVQP
jgi:RND family efflux transporter MFP subunit